MAYYRFQLQSPLTPEAVLEKLRTVVRGQAAFGLSLGRRPGRSLRGTGLLVGKVEDSRFSGRRDIVGKNPFTPEVRGQVKPSPQGSIIDVTMRFGASGWFLTVVWLSVLAYGAVMCARGGNWSAVSGFCAVIIAFAGFVACLFYPDAIAMRLLLESIANPSATAAVAAAPSDYYRHNPVGFPWRHALAKFRPPSLGISERTRKAVTSVISIVAAAFLIGGLIRFPDAPIHAAGNGSYQGKQGQPHTLKDYQDFCRWESASFFAFLITLVAVALLNWEKKND